MCSDQILGKRRYGAAVKSLAPLMVLEENGIIMSGAEHYLESERPPVAPDKTEAEPPRRSSLVLVPWGELFHNVRCLSVRSMLLAVIQLLHQFRPIESN